MRRVEGKIAIVTGGSRNIGQEICVRLAEEGAIVNIFARGSTEETQNRIRALGGEVNSFKVDVSDSSAVESAVAEIEGRYGRIDILVNNAAVLSVHENLLTLSDELWEKEISINLSGTFYCCRSVIARMIKREYGKIVNISSLGGDTGRLLASTAYSASKGGIASMTMSISKSVAKYGINVNTVCPGLIDTDIVKDYTEEQMKRLLSEVPYKRTGEPRDVANAVLFLASDEADYINGERIRVNGGSWMG